LTVTILQAGAARRVLDTDPEFARTALTSIEEVGRVALEDLDHVLGLLRDEDSDTSPQPTLGQLEQLLVDSRAAGVVVDVECIGSVASLPPVVSREAYRIVQEGLTNALRHAGPVPVRLRLHVDANRLELEMTNPLATGEQTRHSDGAASRAGGGGRGLQGIREGSRSCAVAQRRSGRRGVADRGATTATAAMTGIQCEAAT
jgi:signal transduction histidine kinase